jgi:hypothetical protein
MHRQTAGPGGSAAPKGRAQATGSGTGKGSPSACSPGPSTPRVKLPLEVLVSPTPTRALAPLFVVLLAGCGGDDAPEKVPAPTAAEQLCTTVVDTIAGCSDATECQQAIAGDCADVVGVLGDPFLVGWRTCLEAGGDLATCAVSAGESVEPTAAQRAFAKSFCDNCALGVPGCVDVLFGGENPELAPIAQIIAPLSDSVVEEITAECTQGLTCLATFSNCVQGVLAKRALPEKTLLCLVGQLTGTDADAGGCTQGSGGAGAGGTGSGGEGGAGSGASGGTGSGATGSGAGPGSGGGDTGGSGGGGPTCATDANEPNDAKTQATLLDAADDNKLSDCEADQTISAILDDGADDDWFSFWGLDSACPGGIEPHAIVESLDPVEVCVYLEPSGGSDPPTCIEGTLVEDGTYTGCCATGSARLQFGGLVQNDDAHVRIVVSTAAQKCVEYSMTYGFGD